MIKANDFHIDDLVLKWDAKNEVKGKHRNFENPCKGPFKILAFHGNNAYLLKDLAGELLGGRPINGRLINHYFT